MKKLLLLSLTLIVGFFSISSMGQNKCTLGNTTVYSSEDIKLVKTGENTMTTFMPTRTEDLDPRGREFYALSVEPNFNCTFIGISNSDDYLYFEQVPSTNVEVPEGDYSILAVGNDDENNELFLSYQVTIANNTIFVPNKADATYQIHIDGYDEDGNTLSESQVNDMDMNFMYVWNAGERFINSRYSSYDFESDYQKKYNHLENSYIQPFASLTTPQKCYLIQFDPITEETQGYSSNRASDLVSTQAYFNVNNPDSAYLKTNFEALWDNDGWLLCFHGWFKDDHFDPTLPMSIVTNCRDLNPGVYAPGELKFRVIPLVWESYDKFGQTPSEFIDMMTMTGMYLNAQDQFVREPFDILLNNPWNALYHQSKPNHSPMTPALMVENPNALHYYGYRTPIWYYQGFGFGSDNSPIGDPMYGGVFCAFGEGGVQRCTDEDNKLIVKLDGEEIYNDYIFYNNDEWFFGAPNDGTITIDIEDNHVENQGLIMANRTHIEFDLTNEDATPPTLTILQVKDEEGQEMTNLPNLNDSRINFAAGDFMLDLENECMAYFDKPEIEALYSIDGVNYEPLEVVEDESMFHVNYGNFYVVDLAQLEGVANDKWVSLRVTVTDAQGNFQTQELDNLFYAGQFTSINEVVATSKDHSAHPNPFTNEVRITTTDAVNGNADIQIYNVLGEQVYQQAVSCTDTKEFTINGSNLKSGIYFYRINTKNGLLQGKIVKD